MQNQHPIALALKGAAMGIAEAIPGVSGGTIAFITGIYETLLDSIKTASSLVTRPRQLLQPKQFFKDVNGPFLVILLLGMVGGLIAGVFGISYFLVHYPEPLWSFFMGLIVASCVYLLKDVRPFNAQNIISLVVGAIIGLLIVTQTPVEASRSLPMIFLAGAIAISALVLPGISGSFILLLLGLYSYIIPLLKDILSGERLSESGVIVVFAVGCVVGLAVFSRVLTWLFQRHRSGTIAVMIGFMLGSLYKLWPWRNPTSAINDAGAVMPITLDTQSLIAEQDLRILTEQNVLPADYWGEPRVLITLVALILGATMVYILSRSDRNK